MACASTTWAGDFGFGWDYKALPGATCQPQIGAQGADFEKYPHYIINVGASERTVICPIIRDSATETDLDIGISVSRATKQDGRDGVKCTFYSMNIFGDTIGSPHEPSEVVPENGPDPDREIQFFSVRKDETAFDGSYALECVMGPTGRIFRYNAGELARTTDFGE
jgi:hypothetical protein